MKRQEVLNVTKQNFKTYTLEKILKWEEKRNQYVFPIFK